MITVRAYEGRHVAVFGLGASGLAAARSLMEAGAIVCCWDDGEAARDAARDAGLPVADLNTRDWSRFAALVLAPGVPLTHPRPHRVVELARLTETPIIGDMELFSMALAEARDTPVVVAITGTNGKSTATSLVGHIIASEGRDAQVGGNIGRPVLDLDPIHAGAVYVLEVSSFQLDLARSFRPSVSVLLNIAPDHLDRHGDMPAYVAAKRRIFQAQTGRDVAVLGVDDAYTQRIATEMMGAEEGPRVWPISAGRALGRGAHAVGGLLYDALDGRVSEVADLRRARALTGRHNWQNAAAAYAAARAAGLDAQAIARHLLSFPGLPHRMEEVARLGRVRFINDSKATNPAAARQALASYEDVYWIAGGRLKGSGVSELAPLMSRVAKAYLIGESAETIAAQLKDRAVVEIARTLDRAVEAAAHDAAESGRAAPVVLLSPACASFDQFKSFEDRGDVFRSLARGLPGAVLEPAALGGAR